MTKLFSILILFNLTTFHNPKPKTLTWGFYAHSLINRLAVYSLPSEMFGFYKKNIDYLADNAVNPDKRRYAVKDEAPKHYIDLDVYADSVKKKLPTLFWKQAVELYSEDTLMAYGIVPWQIQKMKFQLTQAFVKKDLKQILSGRAAFYSKADMKLDTSAQELDATFKALSLMVRQALEQPI